MSIALYSVDALPDEGAERFLTSVVFVSKQQTSIDNRLDGPGRKRLESATNGKEFVVFVGEAIAAWKSAQDREQCVEYQSKRQGRNDQSRWANVESLAAKIRAGDQVAGGPVYLHPSFTDADSFQLRAIDGTRRLMAAVEAGLRSIEALVIASTGDANSDA